MVSRIKSFFRASDLETLEGKLKKLCKGKEGFVASLVGEWGIGKTFFWKAFVKKYLRKKNVAYITFFGKTSIDEIRRDIVLQVSEKQKAIKDFTDAMGKSRILGVDISALASSFSEDVYKDMIICFDDFERLSEKVSIKDVMGLISELKEEKNCKIILIMNTNKIVENEKSFLLKTIQETTDGLININIVSDKDEAKIYKEYKEKIIDYEFNYNPEIEESFDLIKTEILAFEDLFLEYLKTHNIKNIRVMKKIVRAINDFSFLKTDLSKCPDLIDEMITLLIGMANLYEKKDFIEYKNLSTYTQTKLLNEGEEKQEYEEVLKLLNTNGYFSYTEEVKFIETYLTTSLLDRKSFDKYISEKIVNCKNINMTELVKDEYLRYVFDFNYGGVEFFEKLFNLFDSNKDKIINLLSLDSFIFYINYLKKVSPSNEKDIHALAIDAFKNYLDNVDINSINNNSFRQDSLERIRDFDIELSNYLDQIIIDRNKDIKKDINEVTKLMTEPTKGGWGPKHETILSSISVNEYKVFLESSSDFVKKAYDFLKFSKGVAAFEDAHNNIIKAFIAIYNDSTEDTQNKISNLFDSLKIELNAEVL